MRQKTKSAFVRHNPSGILEALVGIKDVRVLACERRGPHLELVIERILPDVTCPQCGSRARVKEHRVVHYVDLPVYATPMSLAWKKHRLCCLKTKCSIGLKRDRRV